MEVCISRNMIVSVDEVYDVDVEKLTEVYNKEMEENLTPLEMIAKLKEVGTYEERFSGENTLLTRLISEDYECGEYLEMIDEDYIEEVEDSAYIYYAKD